MLVLLDRDGTLNQERPGFLVSPDEMALLPGAAAALARLNGAGHPVALVTNQSAVGRGLIDEAQLERIHDRLKALLAQAGGRLDALFVCPDGPDTPSARRKPAPGMLREAMTRFNAATADTVMIGDDLRDLQAAAAAGCRRILVRTGKGTGIEAAGLPREVLPVAICDDLPAAVALLLDAAESER